VGDDFCRFRTGNAIVLCRLQVIFQRIVGDSLADQFIEGAEAAGHEVEKIYPESHLAGTLFCGGVVAPRTIEGNKKLQEAYELGKSVKV
jgi:TRAP-type C4-dicarboxylate transport system permease large subunit